MIYTVWSKGTLIGETDLGFYVIMPQSRSGWFRPNAAGEPLMPPFASVLPAIRAYLHRDFVDAEGNGVVQPELIGSTLFADIADSFRHIQSLELEIRRSDGTVVRTEDIGIADTRRLGELARLTELEDDADGGVTEDLLFDTEELELDPIDFAEELKSAPFDESGYEWMLDPPQEPEGERYQIHVMLADGETLPIPKELPGVSA